MPALFFSENRLRGLADPQRFYKLLQTAIELEHTTIPPYLYALYSLKPGRNAKIAALLESVVKEEMLHMMLVCNLLNAMGGTPRLDSPRFIPSFPSRAPGSIAGSLKIGLEPFSKPLVRRIFMAIETPHRPLEMRGGRFVIPARAKTIGQLYAAIASAIKNHHEGLFERGDPSRQVVHEHMTDLFVIKNVDSALRAIEIIVEQGEGAPSTPTTDEGEYAHFYRFAEIYRGREIVKKRSARPWTRPENRYDYLGARVPFDKRGVWRVPKNPRASDYGERTRERRACDIFNYTYTTMLRTLHQVVNGRPQLLAGTIGQMFALKNQAMEMMSGYATGGNHIGPTFEYQPNLPP